MYRGQNFHFPYFRFQHCCHTKKQIEKLLAKFVAEVKDIMDDLEPETKEVFVEKLTKKINNIGE